MDSNGTTLQWNTSPREKLKDLPPLQLDEDSRKRLANRKSFRTRPSQLHEREQQDAGRLPAQNVSARQHTMKPQSSTMSLFNLFSKPKVERARGYAEQGLPAPTPDIETSKPELLVQVAANDATRNAPPTRAPSAMSFRSHGPKATSNSKVKPAPTPTPAKERKAPKSGTWEAPPLFQAYPQAMKYGMLEVSHMAAETVLQKAKGRKSGGLHVPADLTAKESMEDRGSSIDTRRGAMTSMRHVASGSYTHVDMPRKIFVLATSGYLLQYAEGGPSDRLPEKVLQLGKDSAAFACDLIPGKHYVLQISQAVDQQGVVVANSGSIFSKLGIRSAAAKRMTTNFLLIMPGAEEMDDWMVTIRAEIEALGGSRARPDTAIRPKTREGTVALNELSQTPSQSHRYQVRRDPTKISTMHSPIADSYGPQLPPAKANEEDDDRAETATMDGIEQDAAQLAEESAAMPVSNNRASDEESADSAAISTDQQRLDSLRSSQRMSHASTARTAATTVETSRTNSLTGSSPSDPPLPEEQQSTGDHAPNVPRYRSLASYGSRRRSAMPVVVREPLPIFDVSKQIQRHSSLATVITDSPVVGGNSPLPAPSISPRKLAVASSEPNLRAAADVKAKHDSKMPTPPLASVEDDRPESFVGDLPPPSTWASVSHRSPSKRVSMAPPPAPSTQFVAQGANQRTASRTSEPVRLRRHSTQPFSLPLKINPSTPANRPPSRSGHRNSLIVNEVDASADPVVHTLTAKVDPAKRSSATMSLANSEVPSAYPERSPSGRLSLFPTHHTPTTPNDAEADATTKRSLANLAPPAHAQAAPNSRMLKRPKSLQVRTNHAPFLSSVRNQASAPLAPGQQRAVTAPIRSLKPSRSATNIVSMGQPSPTDPFSRPSSRLDNPTITEEAADKPTPLPDRTASPLPNRPPSRASGRRVRTRSSLPELDLGIPVVGLGPPAPPPQAPLPLPPSASRPSSPMLITTGLGISV